MEVAFTTKVLPQETIDHIIDEVASSKYDVCYAKRVTLNNCALTCRAWRPRSQMHLHSNITMSGLSAAETLNRIGRCMITYSTRRGLANYVRELSIEAVYDGNTFYNYQWRLLLDLFPKLHKVTLNHIHFRRPVLPHTIFLYSSIKKLDIWESTLPGCRSFLALLSSLPHLTCLVLNRPSVQWVCDGSSIDFGAEDIDEDEGDENNEDDEDHADLSQDEEDTSSSDQDEEDKESANSTTQDEAGGGVNTNSIPRSNIIAQCHSLALHEIQIDCSEGVLALRCLLSHLDFSHLDFSHLVTANVVCNGRPSPDIIFLQPEPVSSLLKSAGPSLKHVIFDIPMFQRKFKIEPSLIDFRSNTGLETLTIGGVGLDLIWPPDEVPDFDWVKDLFKEMNPNTFSNLVINLGISDIAQLGYVAWGDIDTILSGQSFIVFEQLTLMLPSFIPPALRMVTLLTVEELLPSIKHLLPRLTARQAVTLELEVSDW